MNQANKISRFNKLLFAALMLIFAGAQISAFAADSAVKSKPNQIADIRDKWAVVVGVNYFQDSAIQIMPKGLKNALDFSKELKNPQIGRFAPEHVVTICGARASKAAIEKILTASWLVTKALPDDLVVLYFATRVVKSADGDLYLCAYDTVASQADLTGISLRHLLTEIKYRLQSPYILCVLDTESVGQPGTGGPTANDIAQATGVSIFAASDNFEQSSGTTDEFNSYFTHYLVEALKAGNGIWPLTQLAGFVSENVRDVAKNALHLEQNPVIAIASLNKGMGQVPIGVQVKSSTHPTGLSIGYPLSRLAIDRPDLVAVPTARAKRSFSERTETKDSDDDDEKLGRGDVDFGIYMTKMKQDIQKQWHPPKGFENKHVACIFEIMRDGTIVDPVIAETSGVDDVDKSALVALHDSSPLDPLPEGAPPSVKIRYQFDWHVNHP